MKYRACSEYGEEAIATCSNNHEFYTNACTEENLYLYIDEKTRLLMGICPICGEKDKPE